MAGRSISTCEVVENIGLARDTWRMTLHAPDIAGLGPAQDNLSWSGPALVLNRVAARS